MEERAKWNAKNILRNIVVGAAIGVGGAHAWPVLLEYVIQDSESTTPGHELLKKSISVPVAIAVAGAYYNSGSPFYWFPVATNVLATMGYISLKSFQITQDMDNMTRG